jgi:hypothetical protein
MSEIRTKADSRGSAESFVRALYQDMMGRAADTPGLRSWTDALAGGGWNRRQVSDGFANSSEYRQLVVTQAYQRVLSRGPDPSGLRSWMAALEDGTVRLDTIGTALMSSQEFYYRGGSTDAGFVDNIYQAALGRPASGWEITHWGAVRRAQGPAAVIHAVWGSAEAARRRVGDAYTYWLGRSSSAAEREYWQPVVAGAGDEQLREELVVSREYANRAEARFP